MWFSNFCLKVIFIFTSVKLIFSHTTKVIFLFCAALSNIVDQCLVFNFASTTFDDLMNLIKDDIWLGKKVNLLEFVCCKSLLIDVPSNSL